MSTTPTYPKESTFHGATSAKPLPGWQRRVQPLADHTGSQIGVDANKLQRELHQQGINSTFTAEGLPPRHR